MNTPLPDSAPSVQSAVYFQVPAPYFWRWAEGGNVAEWSHGATIAYRDELAELLAGLAPDGLPPLGALLLVLTACPDDWPASAEGRQLLQGLVSGLLDGPDNPDSPTASGKQYLLMHRATAFMDTIRALPPEWRTGPGKRHLLREVFGETLPVVVPAQAPGLLNDWTSGRLDAALTATYLFTPAHYQADLEPLAQAQRRFPTPASLELHLRTGLDRVPAPLELPTLLTPPADLLAELRQDARTAGVARLAQQLVAALRIPLHTQGASDQPLGGISGITNRGNFDRLLLSELAYDDFTLTARLVHNEALYLRREAPPAQDHPQRTVLLDTTLKLWGVTRVFGLAAALAYTQNSPTPAAAYALGGHHAEALDLTTKPGVLAALSSLDPALHCGPALLEQLQASTKPDRVEHLLITDAQLLHEPAFGRHLAEARPLLRFLLTVDRSGEMAYYEYTPSGRVLLGTMHYDLDALLFSPEPAPRPKLPLLIPAEFGERPAFLDCAPSPLFFPTVGSQPTARTAYYAPHQGILAVTDLKRVLHWPKKETGARELLPLIESGDYCFGEVNNDTVGLMVSNQHDKLLRYYAFSLTEGTVESVDLSAEVREVKARLAVDFRQGNYHIRLDEAMLLFKAETAHLDGQRRAWTEPEPPNRSVPDANTLKRFLNNGYNVLQRVTRLEVSEEGELVADGHALQLLPGGHHLKWTTARRPPANRAVAQADADPIALTANPNVPFRRLTWADGSTAVIDSRGLLHLRSADPALPELTLVLVLTKSTAAWAADGAVTGSPYFTGPAPAGLLPTWDFYRKYLQPFLRQLS